MNSATADPVPSGTLDAHGRRHDEVDVVVSDLHLGEGPRVTVEYGGRCGMSRAWHAILHRAFGRGERLEEVDNPFDDFPFDGEFTDFLTLVRERFGEAGTLHLRLLGDTFDPLAVTWQGRYEEPRYEDAALDKMSRIMRGHAGFFRAVSEFLSAPNCRVDVYIGNHDLFLAWPSVRRLITDELTAGCAEKISRLRFICQEHGFETLERGVLYSHGNRSEAHNYVAPKDVIVDEVFGVKLKRPILNIPYGSYAVVNLVLPLKRRNPLVGRMRHERYIWWHAMRHRWLWGLYAGVMLVWHFLYSSFFAALDIRRKSSLRRVLGTAAATVRSHPVDDDALQLLKERDDVRVIVFSHTHAAIRVSNDYGTYINTGNWSRSFRLEEKEFVLKWGAFRRLEFCWRALAHFFRTGEVRFAWRLIKFAGIAAAIAAISAYVCGAFDGGAWDFWPMGTAEVKTLAAIALAFLLVTSLFRLFAVEPTVVDDTKFTFALIRHGRDASLKADLMEYLPEEKNIRECV